MKPLRALQIAQSRTPVSSVTAWAHRHGQTWVTASSLGALSTHLHSLLVVLSTKQSKTLGS